MMFSRQEFLRIEDTTWNNHHFSLPKNCDLQYLHKKTKSGWNKWVFPLSMSLSTWSRWFLHQGFYDAQRRKEMKKTRQVMGLQITYVGVAFSVIWSDLAQQIVIYFGLGIRKNHCFSRTCFAATIFWDNFDAHVGFSWLWKSWAFSKAVQG